MGRDSVPTPDPVSVDSVIVLATVTSVVCVNRHPTNRCVTPFSWPVRVFCEPFHISPAAGLTGSVCCVRARLSDALRVTLASAPNVEAPARY